MCVTTAGSVLAETFCCVILCNWALAHTCQTVGSLKSAAYVSAWSCSSCADGTCSEAALPLCPFYIPCCHSQDCQKRLPIVSVSAVNTVLCGAGSV